MPARHHQHDEQEHQAQQHVPSFDVGRGIVLQQQHQRGADGRAAKRARAAGDNAEQAFSRTRDRERSRVDIFMVVDVKQPGYAAPEAGVDEGDPSDHPGIEAERRHPARLVAHAFQRRAERRRHEDRHHHEGERRHNQREPVERGGAVERDAERHRPGQAGYSVVAVGDVATSDRRAPTAPATGPGVIIEKAEAASRAAR